MTTGLPAPRSVAEYVKQIVAASPQEAVQIALAEADRAQAEYRSLAEVTFDSEGRIATANLAGLWRLAQMYAGSAMVPDHYRGKPHDCFIACEMAFRLRVAVFAYMQMSFIVHGKPGIEAKLAVAMLNTSGKIKGRVQYTLTGEVKNKTRACMAYATDAETGERIEATVDWSMVEAEGWNKKAGSKWLTMPDVMFHYRSAVFLIRMFYPEVLMGMRTLDELEDVGGGQPVITGGEQPRTLDDLAARLSGPLAGNGNGRHEPDDESRSEPFGVTDHVGPVDDHDRPQTGDEPDGDLLETARAAIDAAASMNDTALIDKAEDEYSDRAATDGERSSIAGMAQEARERCAKPKGGKQKAFTA